MYKYQANFAGYKLRDYEKQLALREFENQFPTVKEKSVTERGISFATSRRLNASKLEKLSFYSEIRFQNVNSEQSSILTD